MSEEVTRRGFLSRLWKAGASLMAVAGAWTSWDVLRPPPSAAGAGPVRTLPPSAIPEKTVLEIKSAHGYLTRNGDEVVALSWKCPHLGCRVPWCDSSSEFECPCHGSVFNRVGEYREGPAPRGMDRYAVSVQDGVLVVDTSSVITGPPHGPESIDEPPTGPRCVGGD
ncbi:MAG: ubiquinol-cytochrome c reductase iron-sulfur subunit [Acidimicrobiia bacterium]